MQLKAIASLCEGGGSLAYSNYRLCSQSHHIIEYAGSATRIAGDLRFAGSNYKTHITQILDVNFCIILIL